MVALQMTIVLPNLIRQEFSVFVNKSKDIEIEEGEEQNQFLKIVKDITSKGFVRNNYKKKLVDLSDIRINLKGKK